MDIIASTVDMPYLSILKGKFKEDIRTKGMENKIQWGAISTL